MIESKGMVVGMVSSDEKGTSIVIPTVSIGEETSEDRRFPVSYQECIIGEQVFRVIKFL